MPGESRRQLPGRWRRSGRQFRPLAHGKKCAVRVFKRLKPREATKSPHEPPQALYGAPGRAKRVFPSAGRGPVVSVRLEPELIERLDALAERTKRSRGTYLRMALWAALPELERIHWEQAAADFEELAIKDAFEEITQQLMDEANQRRKSG